MHFTWHGGQAISCHHSAGCRPKFHQETLTQSHCASVIFGPFRCQGPSVGGFYGIWRHTAFRFFQGSEEEGIESEMELYVDGKSVCGVRFPANIEMVPQ